MNLPAERCLLSTREQGGAFDMSRVDCEGIWRVKPAYNQKTHISQPGRGSRTLGQSTSSNVPLPSAARRDQITQRPRSHITISRLLKLSACSASGISGAQRNRALTLLVRSKPPALALTCRDAFFNNGGIVKQEQVPQRTAATRSEAVTSP